MSLAEDIGAEGGGDDIVAAEYVLGVLPSGERQVAAARIDREPRFARLVDLWEVHLSPLAAAYLPVEPPETVKAAVDRRLLTAASGTGTAPAQAAAPGVWASLAFWRGLAAAALAALALYVAIPYISPPAETPQMRLVASLAAAGSDVQYLVVYDAAEGEVALSHVSGDRAAGQDFELWMIEGSNAPVSMGVIPVGASVHLPLSPAAREQLNSGDVLAVSLEPAGGSTTGQPTGPVVAAGDLKSI
jgi:anti-sigma-K factor RskA